MAKLTPELSVKLALNDVSNGLDRSTTDSSPEEGETKKAQEIPGFVAICRLLSSSGFTLRMGEEGLEPPTSTL
jgi:hypothetical protein